MPKVFTLKRSEGPDDDDTTDVVYVDGQLVDSNGWSDTSGDDDDDD